MFLHCVVPPSACHGEPPSLNCALTVTGAAIAVQIAHDFPELVSGLILHGPPLITSEEMKEAVRTKYSTPELAADGTHLQQIWDRILEKDPSLPVPLIHREAMLSITAGEHYVAGYVAVANQNLVSMLPSITVPVCLMAGGRDSLKACVEPTRKKLSNASKCTVEWLPEDSGTYVCDTHPEIVAKVIMNWISSLCC